MLMVLTNYKCYLIDIKTDEIKTEKFANLFSTVLSGEKQQTDIHFTHFSISGLEEMHRYSTDERLYEFFEFAPFKTIDETKAYIGKLLDRMSGEPLVKRHVLVSTS